MVSERNREAEAAEPSFCRGVSMEGNQRISIEAMSGVIPGLNILAFDSLACFDSRNLADISKLWKVYFPWLS